jgi:hypothetical protein
MRKNQSPALVRRIGKTTYHVKVHFSDTNTETFGDKIRRMFLDDVARNVAAADNTTQEPPEIAQERDTLAGHLDL